MPHTKEFQSQVIRQLRTPLSGLARFADSLEAESGGEQRRFTHLIKRISRHLLDSVETVLFLERMSEESVRPAAEKFDLAAECRDALDRHRSQAIERELVLMCEAPRSLPVVMDREVVRRILDNLISSSLRYLDKGGATLAASEDDGVITISLRDTGRGIPPEMLPHLSAVLVEPSPESGEDLDRVGMELALANRLIRLVGGKLDIRSTAGIGSIFTVRLPIVEGGTTAPAAESGASDAPPALPKLLLLEDNDVTRRVLGLMLDARYAVSAASGYDEAMELAAFHSFDILLLDIHLSERRTGVEALHAIRCLPQYRKIPAVACTAYGLPGLRERFLEAGFNGYIAKPFKKQQLLDVLAAALKAAADGETGLPAEKVDIKLPPLPDTLPKILKLMVAGQAAENADALAAILERDPIITSRVLRHVNSPFYSVRGKVASIERAVTLLGFEPVCNLVLAEVLARTFGGFDSPRAKRVHEEVLKQSLAAAAFAREIAVHLKMADQGLAFAAGLLHQLGRLGLLASDADGYAALWFTGGDDAPPLAPPRGQELLGFGSDHVSVGTVMAQKWVLPEELRTVIRHYADEPLPADLPHRSLVMLVSASRVAAQGLALRKDAATQPGPESDALKDLAEQHRLRAVDLALFLKGKAEFVRGFVEKIFKVTEDRD